MGLRLLQNTHFMPCKKVNTEFTSDYDILLTKWGSGLFKAGFSEAYISRFIDFKVLKKADRIWPAFLYLL